MGDGRSATTGPTAASAADGRSKRRPRTPLPLGAALVVEDDPLIAMELVDGLREAGADPVETCPNAECARAMLEQLKPAIMVLDSRLQDRDDGWALAELAALMGPQGPRIIFATGSPEGIPPEIAALGTVLGKPFSAQDLIAAVTPRRPESLLGRLREALGKDS